MNLSFWFLYLVTLIVVSRALISIYGKKIVFTPLSLYMALYLVVQFPGSIYLYLAREATDHGFLFLMWSGAILPLILPLVVMSIQNPYDGTTVVMPVNKYIIIIVIAFGIAIAATSIILMRRMFPMSPLLLLLDSDGSQTITGSLVAKAREETIQGSGRLFAVFALIPRVFLTLITMFALEAYLQGRSRVVFIAFVVLFFATTILSMFSGSKATAIYFWIALILFYYHRRGYPFKKKEILWSLVAFVLFNLYIGTWYYLYLNDINRVISGLAHRLFVTYPEIVCFIHKNFGHQYDYLYGTTFPNPRGILPFENVNFALLIGKLYKNTDLQTVANTISFAEWYANFGYLGAILWQLIVGILLHSFYIWYQRSPKDFISVAMFSIMTVNLSLLSVQYTGSIISYPVIFLVLTYIAIRTTITLVRYWRTFNCKGAALDTFPK